MWAEEESQPSSKIDAIVFTQRFINKYFRRFKRGSCFCPTTVVVGGEEGGEGGEGVERDAG